jgi:poly(hydroxyalkanoate) depolymerase family esterase
VKRFWLRITALWERLRARLFRREVVAGRFEAGRAASRSGLVTTAPLVPPARDYLVYVPRGYSRWRRAPLVVMCHGCRQTPEAFTDLAGIAAHADRAGTLVLLPRQMEAANRYGCWNWFESGTAHGGGEAAIVAAQIVDVRRRYRARRERVWVVGLSAGGALAAVMGLRHPRLVRGVVTHSGLACGAASNVATAIAVMAHGPDNDVARVADGARAAHRDASVVPLLVIQGDRDDVVAPVNGVALAIQYLRFNGHPAGTTGYKPAATLPASDASSHESAPGRHPIRVDEWTRAGRVVVRHVTVQGLGHAWSGGDDGQPFADPQGPDALALFARFAAEAAA